jgi:hypothetical protein
VAVAAGASVCVGVAVFGAAVVVLGTAVGPGVDEEVALPAASEIGREAKPKSAAPSISGVRGASDLTSMLTVTNA